MTRRDGGPGAFRLNPCTLSQTSSGVASCSVSYTPDPSGSLRSDTITASYIGTHKASSATTTVKVQPTTKGDCQHGGWKNYGFANQGRCIQFLRGS